MSSWGSTFATAATGDAIGRSPRAPPRWSRFTTGSLRRSVARSTISICRCLRIGTTPLISRRFQASSSVRRRNSSSGSCMTRTVSKERENASTLPQDTLAISASPPSAASAGGRRRRFPTCCAFTRSSDKGGRMNRLVLLFGLVAAVWSGAAGAQAWPQKPVRVLVGLAPGGNPDTLARMLAAKWTAALGQQFVVENRPGAGSTVAADLTAKSPPDGYTVLISDSSVVTMAPHLFKSLPYDPMHDLAPVSLAVVVPMWLVVHPSVPAHTVAELVALA